jgi:hypothetical protein
MSSILETIPLRPRVVMAAAVLGLLTGGMALIVSTVVVLVLGVPDLSRNIVAWLVAVGQVAGALLLIVGSVRLAAGAGPVLLTIGTVVQLVAWVAYGYYTVLDISRDTTEPASTAMIYTIVALVFAILPVASLVLANTRSATEFTSLFAARPGLPGGRRGW